MSCFELKLCHLFSDLVLTRTRACDSQDQLISLTLCNWKHTTVVVRRTFSRSLSARNSRRFLFSSHLNSSSNLLFSSCTFSSYQHSWPTVIHQRHQTIKS